MTQLSEHFHEREFKCRHCGALHPDGVPEQLVKLLENVRAHFDAPVHINSGYRCEIHNEKVGGATHSQHLLGRAADITVRGFTPAAVYTYCNQMVGSKGGVGKYNSFTHIDCRGHKKRW